MKSISSWGRLTAPSHHLVSITESKPNLKRSTIENNTGLAYGMGRSYGDVCLNPAGTLWSTAELDHFIDFNEKTGRLICESGVLLRDIQRLLIPHGWALPVTPGTQIVTVGGAIANDVHGKNHHVKGSFGNHVLSFDLHRTDGESIQCEPSQNADWFAATIGGLGLTGVITQAEIQLQRVPGPWLESETIPYTTLSEFFELADRSEADWEYTVSWIDCVSTKGAKGLFMRANPTERAGNELPSARKMTMPFSPPFSLVNPLSLRAFNFTYYHLKKWAEQKSIVHYEPFFYPLDNLLKWNRMYGPKGFFQYQSVIPWDIGPQATQEMLNEISKAGEGSFLAVLKTFGEISSIGMLSFPKPGVTLALDFPNRGERTKRLFERLDAIVIEAGGRIYPAKDARMSPEMFITGYPRLNEFLKYRDSGISSGLSRRLMGY